MKAVKDLPKYVVTVDAVEAATGINFFPQLDEAVESVVNIDVTTWPALKLDEDDKDE
jgi:DNA/RNA endonuclease G (NUC1)